MPATFNPSLNWPMMAFTFMKRWYVTIVDIMSALSESRTDNSGLVKPISEIQVRASSPCRIALSRSSLSAEVIF